MNTKLADPFGDKTKLNCFFKSQKKSSQLAAFLSLIMRRRFINLRRRINNYEIRHLQSDIQVRHAQCVGLDKVTARLNFITHQGGK